jgi:uncharacterized protein (DUF488 family)
VATAAFAEGVAELRTLADDPSVAVCCSESLWWRCHRRLVADHLVLVEDRPVEHLFQDGRLQTHPVTAEAQRTADHVTYDLGTLPLS